MNAVKNLTFGDVLDCMLFYTDGEPDAKLPAGPIFSHISLQSYERGDFRIFNRTLYDDKIKRPRGFAGENPVYDPGSYLTGSGE